MATATDALTARVAEAVDGLPRAGQIALQMSEHDGEDHAAIALALRMDEASVPELLLSARLAVYAALRRGAPPRQAGRACGPARRGLVQLQDSEPATGVREHVDHCESCQALRRALREASVAYRAWDGTRPERAATPKPSAPPPSVPAAAPRRRSSAGPTLAVRYPSEAQRPRYPTPLPAKAPPTPREVIIRRRWGAFFALIVTVVVVVLAVNALEGSRDDTQGTVTNGSDVIPPPGEQFCATGEPDCP